MQPIFHILLSNAAGAALLAAVVWPICLVARRPAVCRALWIVVLLKLLAPPLVAVPVNKWFAPRQPTPVAISLDSPMPGEIDLSPNPPAAPPMPKPVVFTPSWTARFITSLPAIWAVGTASFLILGLGRIAVLVRLLSRAPLAPNDIQQLARSVAIQLGIANPPIVCFVPGVVCPALWAFGRKRVIIPLTLWNRLDHPKRLTLLAHELAHLRRGDHWVRLLEFVAGVIYWWHPVVWVARRQIHDFEEQCCDAWVLWAMPASAHSYGSALLEAVDFVSATRPMVPALSAGLGEFRHLKRRLLMIKQGSVSRALSKTSLFGICALGAMALPLAPGLAQEAPPSTPPARGLPGGSAGNDENAPGNQAEIAQARAIVAQAQADVQRAQANFREARRRLMVLEHGSAPAAGSSGYGGGVGNFGGGGNGSAGGGFGGGGGGFRGEGGGGGFGGGGSAMGGMMRGGVAPGGMAGGGGNFGPPRAGNGTSGGGGGSMSIPGNPGGPPPRPGMAGAMPPAAPGRGDPERRLQGLEDQLRQLMDQVRELRDLQQHRPDQPGEPGR